MVAIIDYGVGNLFSLHASFQAIGQPSAVTSDPAQIAAASHVILPGVGAFADAAAKLRGTGLDEVLCVICKPSSAIFPAASRA